MPTVTVIALAAAAPLVVDAADVDAAVALARPFDAEVTPLPLHALQQLPATAGRAGVLRRCTRERASLEAVRADLVRAEAALALADLVAVADHLDLATARLGCLDAVADPAVAARVFLLRAGVAAARGQPDAAREELRTALGFAPDAGWPEPFPAEGAPLLAEVTAEVDRYTLSLSPPASSGPWLDGRPTSGAAPVRAGLHLVQHSARAGLVSQWLVVGGDADFVVPEALPASALDRFASGDPASVAAVLRGLHPEGAWVAHRGGLWWVDAAGVHERVAPAPLLPPPNKGKRGR